MFFKRGFTLIELLVVIGIIGIVAGMLTVSISGAINAANDAKRKTDIDTLRKVIIYYKAQNTTGLYPVEATECTIGGGSTPCTTITSAIEESLPAFPVDPISGYYTYESVDGTDFTISTTMSNEQTYSYNSETGFTIAAGGGIEYVSTCLANMGNGIVCTETTDGSYIIYSFTYTSDTGITSWTVPEGVTALEYLIIGGGGSGGRRDDYASGGGGGAGGLLQGALSVTSGYEYDLKVGAGGTVPIGTSGPTSAGNPGSSSQFDTLIAAGGGGGGGKGAPTSGGSGGGGSGWDYKTGAAGTSQQGYAGGNGDTYNGAGGGGANSIGSNGSGNKAGGIGLQSSITGAAIYYAGGGGGGAAPSYGKSAGAGGTGGGGAGGIAGTNGLGGGGGGGAQKSALSGAGGSGIVIIRFYNPNEEGYSPPEIYVSTCTDSINSEVDCHQTLDGSYVINTLTYISGGGVTSWDVPFGVSQIEYLVVGGGGGGGAYGGGGGAGGMRFNAPGTFLTVSGTLGVVVGAGGAGGLSQGSRGTNGNDSILGPITSSGGGGGAGQYQTPGSSGGSGGGGSYGTTTPGNGNIGGFTPSEGNNGGSGTNYEGGGGGGAGQVGGNAIVSSRGGLGGNGLESSITGAAIYYAGGGAGGSGYYGSGTTGGLGGGGNSDGGEGTNNLGGGGGGTGYPGNVGGKGGSGVIIIRYLHP